VLPLLVIWSERDPLKKSTYTVLALTLTVIFTIVFSPLSNSGSSNPCSCSFHPGYYQYLNILPTDSNTQIPSSLAVNQTTTVSVTIENDVSNYRVHTALSNVVVTLTSAFGHFSGGSSINVGDLAPGAQTVSWQINGLSDGYDYFEISLTGINNHKDCFFQDSYQPLVTVGQPNETIPNAPTPSTQSSTQIQTTTTTQTSTSQHSSSQTNSKTTSSSTPSPSEPGNTQAPLEIQLLSPSRDATWPAQTNQTLTWTALGGKEPLNVTLAWSLIDSNGSWTSIRTNLPANGSLNWVTPSGEKIYYIKATVQDLENSAQTAITQVTGQTENMGLPLLPVALATAATVIVLTAIILVKRMKAGKQKN
jgi:hypothetical protein